MCLLPSNYAGNDEEALIKAINNSPGNYLCTYCVDSHIEINIRNKDVVRSPSIFLSLTLLGGR